MTSHAIAPHAIVLPPPTFGSRLLALLSDAGSAVVLTMFVPIAILVVGAPIAFVAGLVIALLERL